MKDTGLRHYEICTVKTLFQLLTLFHFALSLPRIHARWYNHNNKYKIVQVL